MVSGLFGSPAKCINGHTGDYVFFLRSVSLDHLTRATDSGANLIILTLEHSAFLRKMMDHAPCDVKTSGLPRDLSPPQIPSELRAGARAPAKNY